MCLQSQKQGVTIVPASSTNGIHQRIAEGTKRQARSLELNSMLGRSTAVSRQKVISVTSHCLYTWVASNRGKEYIYVFCCCG